MASGKRGRDVSNGIVWSEKLQSWVMKMTSYDGPIERPITYLEADGKPVEPPMNKEI